MTEKGSFRERTIRNISCLYCTDKLLEPFFFSETPCDEWGMLVCPSCGRWYPLWGGIIEVLSDDKIDWATRKKFWDALLEKGYAPVPGVSFDTSFDMTFRSGNYGFSDDMVNVYDDIAVRTPFWQRVEGHFVGKWFKALEMMKGKGTIFEAACGSGRMTEKFSAAGFNIVGIDITFKMIEKAHAKAVKAGLAENIVYIVADAEKLPFPGKMFDACIFCGFLHHLDTPLNALKEISRVLKKGGMVLGMDNHSSSMRWLFDIMMKIVPLWKEEGGTHQTISIPVLNEWGGLSGIKFTAVPYCYVPPHLYRLTGEAGGNKIFDWTNRVFQKNRYLKNMGGLLDIEGVVS